MKEYIERKAVLDIIKNKWFYTSGQTFVALKELPTADVEPVKHGEWNPYPSDAYMKCSVCGIEYLTSKMPQVVGYCPHCGAKMDGGNSNG